MVIKVKGREGRPNEKKCIEGRKGGVIAKKTSLEPGVRIYNYAYVLRTDRRIQEFVQRGLKFFSLSRAPENP